MNGVTRNRAFKAQMCEIEREYVLLIYKDEGEYELLAMVKPIFTHLNNRSLFILALITLDPPKGV